MRVLVLFILCLTSFNLQAQHGPIISEDYNCDAHQKQHPTKSEIMAQKVAFITQELELTPAEAEKFWPVYNENNALLRNARRTTMNSLKKLNEALDASPEVPDTEIKKLTDDYLNNYKKEGVIYVENFNKFQKILPLRKAVKIFNAEENFRVYLIKNLRGDKPSN